jgi:hypothetical protein
MKRVGASLAAFVSILALTAGSVFAVTIPGTLDQQQTNAPDGGYLGSDYYRAQTFTAGLTGTLDAVTLETGTNSPGVVAPAAAGDFTVAIWATSGGLPTGSALASELVTGNAAGSVAVIFGSPTSVVAGTKYAIVLVPDVARGISWLGTCVESYAGGQALVYDVLNYPTWRTVPAWASDADSTDCFLDFAFATYVTAGSTPPPTATSTAPSKGSSSPAPLLAAAIVVLAAAAFVTRRRYGITRD